MANLIGQRLDRYEIVSLLGEGGMATVYRARQANMKRDVAVKIIESRLARNPDFVKRFEREAQTVAGLSHIHILKVFDYGQQGDLIYLVMELLTGGSLADLIRPVGCSTRWRRRWTTPTAWALFTVT
jgi:serine/threonine protein kinase